LTLVCSRRAAGGAGLVALALRGPGGGDSGRAGPAGGGSAAFMAVFLVGARLLKHKELEMAWRVLRRRRGR
jgi:hypothetical protein